MADVKKVVQIEVESDINKATQDTKKLDKGLKGVNKASGQASKGVKAIGTALKGAGIGLLVGAIAGLMAVFSKNQKVIDTMSTAMNTLQLGFNAVTGAISSAYTKVTEATDGFDALKKVVLGVIKLAITPLKLAFYEIKSAIQVANVAYQTMFGDDESIKEAKKDLFETTEALKQVGKDAIQSGKDIVNNFGEAVTEVGTGVKTLRTELGKIEPKKILQSAENMTELSKQATSAGIALQGVIADFDRQAEQQRQLRDDERKPLEQRQKANADLKKTLEDRAKVSLQLVDLEIANALAVDKANGNQESANALQEAYNKKKEILAGIEGQISEQKANDLALDKEGVDLIDSKLEGENAVSIRKKQFIAEQIQDEVLKNEKLREILEEEKQIELDRLTAKRDGFAEGTQAYVDANNELEMKKQEFAERDIELGNKIVDAKRKQAEDEVLLKKKAEQTKTILAQKSRQQQENQLQAIGNALTSFGKLAKKDSKGAKALAVSGALINTYLGITKALTIGDPITKWAQVAAVSASGFAAVKNIKKTKTVGDGGSGSSSGGFSVGNVPRPTMSFASSSFDSINGQEATNGNVASQMATAVNDRPVQTFVTADDVASSRAYVQQRIDNTSF